MNGYEKFFGFTEPPFSLSVNTRFRFASASHDAALAQVTYALERREPVVVVTGDIGMGKTLLCRTVVERLPRKTFLSIINDPLLDRDELLKRILEDFGVISANGAEAVHTSRHELVHALEKFLGSLAQIDAHAVVIVDEAQHVQPDVLEQIRLLANIHDERGTLLQIVLVGQPDLQALLARPELQQLRQRVTRSVNLNALTDEEVRQYIAHRLVVAREAQTASLIPGAHDLARAIAEWDESHRPATFDEEAMTAVARQTRGVPRLVNLLCDRALETAYAQRSRTVQVQMVDTAADALHLSVPLTTAPPDALPGIDMAATNLPGGAPGRSHRRRYVAAAAVVVIAGGIVWLGGRTVGHIGDAGRRAVDGQPPQPLSRGNPPAPAPSVRPTPPAGAAPQPAEPPISPTATRQPPATVETAAGQGYEIVVASFHTEARATDVAAQLAAFGQRVRQRAIGGWQQVVAGPFPSKEAADEAQRDLERRGFTGTHVVRESR